MRIGIDATVVFSDKPSGLGVYTVNMVNELYRLHEDMVVWTVADAGFNLPSACLRHVMKPLAFLGNSLYPLRPLWLELFFRRQLQREGVDVLWSTVPSALSHVSIPHLVTVHDLIPLRYPDDVPPWVRWSFAKRVLPAIGAADAVITDSVATQDDLVRSIECPPPVEVVYPAFDAAHFRPVDPQAVLARYSLDTVPYLLYVGNASPRKNLHSIVQAFGKISASVPHLLVIAGSKSRAERSELGVHIDRTGLSGRVLMLDYLAYSDLPALYSGAACVVYLSRYEGFGLPVLEAMACGAPVVTSSVTSLPEVAGGAALLVDPDDTDAAALAVRKVLNDQTLRQKMIESGLRQSRGFSWSESASHVVRILHDLAGDHHV